MDKIFDDSDFLMARFNCNCAELIGFLKNATPGKIKLPKELKKE